MKCFVCRKVEYKSVSENADKKVRVPNRLSLRTAKQLNQGAWVE